MRGPSIVLVTLTFGLASDCTAAYVEAFVDGCIDYEDNPPLID